MPSTFIRRAQKDRAWRDVVGTPACQCVVVDGRPVTQAVRNASRGCSTVKLEIFTLRYAGPRGETAAVARSTLLDGLCRDSRGPPFLLRLARRCEVAMFRADDGPCALVLDVRIYVWYVVLTPRRANERAPNMPSRKYSEGIRGRGGCIIRTIGRHTPGVRGIIDILSGCSK